MLQDTYTEPDTEWEYFTEKIAAYNVRKGDRLAESGEHASKIITGNKYVTVKDANDRQILRVPLDDSVEVVRRRETEASRKASRRVYSNMSIVRELNKDWDAPRDRALAKIHEHTDKGWKIDYGQYGDLMARDAERWVWRRFEAACNYVKELQDPKSDKYNPEHELFESEHVDLLRDFIAEETKTLISAHRQRSLSRSTSVMSNLLEDVESEAIANFIDNSRWWSL